MLFFPSDIPPEESNSNVKQKPKRPWLMVSFESYAKFAQDFSTISPDCDYHIINHGSWSMHEFLLFLINKFTGPASLWITTWSISEKVIQQLVAAKMSGNIVSINFLFDYRVKKYRPAAYYLAEKHFNCRLTSCHAKVTVIKGEKMDLTIVGSANYTRNNRIEVMILMPGTDEAEKHSKWINNRITAD